MLNEQELIAFLENTLSPADRRRVEEELACDPELRQRIVRQAQMDRALGIMLGEPAATERVKQAVLATLRGESDDALKRQVLEDAKFLRRPPSLGQRLRAWWERLTQPTAGWVMAGAAAGLVLLGVLVLPPIAKRSSSGSQMEMPSLVKAPTNSEWRRGETVLSPDARRELQAGDVLVVATNGSGTVTFKDGTVLHLEPGARVLFGPAHPDRRGGKQLTLLAGALSAAVAKQPPNLPLLIHTPHALVTVVGTEFDLNVATNQTALEVTHGLVKLTSDGDAQPVSVAAGEFAVAAPRAPMRYGRLARHPYLWPFSSASIWNRPLGSGAQFAPIPGKPFLADGPLTDALRPRRPFLGSPTDPLRRIWVNGEVRADVRLADAHLPGMAITDSWVLLQQGRRDALELCGVRVRADGDLEAQAIARTDLAGPGVAESTNEAIPFGLSNLGGLLRSGELETGIRHALSARINRERLAGRIFSRPLTVWPATGNPASGADAEELCVGTLLAIPPGIDLAAKFGTNGPAYELARAMQDYGVYVTGFIDAPFVLLSDDAAYSRADAWLNQLVPLLQVVSKNSPATPAGGGKPRCELAPALPGEAQ